jgi:TolA-binding protein
VAAGGQLARLAAALLALAPAAAVAQGNPGERLKRYEDEALTLGTNLPRPNVPPTGAANQRRLIDAEVAFALGDYDTAALALFDLVGKPAGPTSEPALYYLAESLYHKGDRSAARGYFTQLIKSTTVASKYHQPALVRLVEIAIHQRDNTDLEPHLAALAGMSPAVRQPVVPYVLGKYAFSQDKHDEALALFASVPKGSDYEMQAAYFTATAQIAKGELGRATDIYTDLINRKPRSNIDRRVIELSQLALGRLYYEREQMAKSIDSYLLVDRRSDLFPDALYEVAWVYVKSKQYDKALRALELLEASNPNTQNTPTVRILEGNLRIRKAQLIRQAQVSGTINPNDPGDPEIEYAKAADIFADTNAMFAPAHAALARMVEGKLDPAAFIDQIAGRNEHVFQAVAPIPEVAAQWLRQEPEVQRFVSVETDLGGIETDLEQSEATIARLEAVIAANDRSALYPKIAQRRARVATIQHDLIGIRQELLEQQVKAAGAAAESAARRSLYTQYAPLLDPEQAHAERTAAEHRGYDTIALVASEIASTIDSTQAVSVALRKYMIDADPPLADDVEAATTQGLDDAAREARAIEDELAAIRRELVLGKDLAGVGDAQLAAARALRKQVQAAQDAEQRALSARGNSNAKALGERAAKLAGQLAQLDAQLERSVEQGIAEVKAALAAERKAIDEYKRELAEFEAESKALGAEVLGASFADVQAKLYDVVIRSDVGTIDVAWARKEDNDDDLKRLNLARSRDLRQLRDEFRFILDETTQKPSEPKPASPAAATTGEAGASPDTGQPGDRIKPAGDQAQSAPQPVVKPDNAPAQGGGR